MILKILKKIISCPCKKDDFVFNPNNYEKEIISSTLKNNNTITLNEKNKDYLIIQNYCQININAGIIFGMPSDLTPYFTSSFKKANDFFDNDEYFTINPTLLTDKDSREYTTYLLPTFLTMAIIDRTNTFDTNSDCSSIRVIWWQHTIGLPEPEILEKLKNITWKEPYAWNWQF